MTCVTHVPCFSNPTIIITMQNLVHLRTEISIIHPGIFRAHFHPRIIRCNNPSSIKWQERSSVFSAISHYHQPIIASHPCHVIQKIPTKRSSISSQYSEMELMLRHQLCRALQQHWPYFLPFEPLKHLSLEQSPSSFVEQYHQ